ncbi:DUF58 domain-containing protein [Paenibacillus sp. B01]|uniref:DUF58 domain-containing protein n=1 Tax=Paenibacillus sp. B01 TaxID=2660554 RepID=UPI00129BD539|nr:DUF58 domain-containing protein [Paenibacillus sp. B01]QGG58334.1 DUF58 domain-containing protein [Paenibacillus sp. B01]
MGMLALLAALAAALGLQGLLLGRWALRGVRVERSFSASACHAGDAIEMVETIENGKRLPVPWLRLEAMLPAGLLFRGTGQMSISSGSIYQNHASLFTLPPRVRIIRRHAAVCASRGVWHMGTATMTGGDLFGLFAASIKVELPWRLVVYPELAGLERLPESWLRWQGELEVRRWVAEDPFVTSGVRDYAPGDAMNRIHWKASARSAGLQVHRYGHTANPRAMLLLNVEESETMWGRVNDAEGLEEALRCAATSAAELLRRGLGAGFAHNAMLAEEAAGLPDRVEPGYGGLALEPLLEAMAAVAPQARVPFHELLRQEADRQEQGAGGERLDYLLITAHESARVREAAERLSALGHGVTIVRPPSADGRKRRREPA